MLAQRIAQLDQMARGRFHWGIGSGGFIGDFELFELDTQKGEQRALARDVLDAVLTLWNDPRPGVYEHPRWRFRVPDHDDDIGISLHLRPYQKPHPPIGVAGISPRSDMLTLGGQRGWIPMSINIVPVPTLQMHWQTYAESAAKAGRKADRSIWRIAREVYVGDTSAEARREALDGVIGRDWSEYMLRNLAKSKMLVAAKSDPSMPDEAVTLEYLCDNIWIVGNVDEVTEKLARLYQDVGGFGTLLVIGHEWLPKEKWTRSMTRLVEEVLPRVQGKLAEVTAPA
jgi:alkanesulfonate monooxygenase SsuD/methylene tetrahydromethanopterin reductase-like flavin-dependent oxidoreductase (luciferase family)